MTPVRNYPAHQARVTSVYFALNCEWVLSIGRDKMFHYHCSETGRRLGSFQSEAWCTALAYPFKQVMCDNTELLKYYVWLQTAVACGLG